MQIYKYANNEHICIYYLSNIPLDNICRKAISKHYMKHILYLCTLLLALSSCNDEVANTYGSKPMAMGRLNDMVVIADKDLYTGMVGDTFKQYFESAYPIMPFPEPLFDIRHFTPNDLVTEGLRKELRTYVILADLSDDESAATQMVRKDIGEERYLKAKKDKTFDTTVGKDKWARGQLVIYLFGNGEKALAATISEKFSAVADRIRLHDEEQLQASIYAVKRENAGLIRDVEGRYGFTLKVPGDFTTVLYDSLQNLTWMRKDENDYTSNIVLKEYKYERPDQLTKANIIALRDEYAKEFIAGPSEGSYMVTNTEDLPIYEYTYEINGYYTKEIRGVWEMDKDFIGGPYVTYVILDQENGRFLLVDTFVYSPGKDKRDLVQQLEYIVKKGSFVKS